MSPGTSSSAGIMRVSPPRTVRASADSMLRIELQRLLGLAFLDEAEQRVEDDDAEDDRRVEPQVEHQLGEAGAKQDVDQDVVELRQEPHERSPLLAFRQPVWPVLLQAVRRLGRIQTPPGVGGETFRHLVHGHTMPGYGVGCGIGVRCSAHWCAP